ncbi:PHA/PHB synthase family protein [Rhodocyclus gracilis]|uniref:Class I poly(R)-hydroxyalkanoic acid synthase n=1 Tax=Rhodocyclus tenuis TaxID=1066 RepID=A0A6L5JUN9_RHOTE|nr:class I poly(R)-hydroxyalkanoic acid synthase [Rhodocyclus gracilis]MQY50314.1 class I poly(R)-hydroxyalkanoic acid synthase [Rhodocyclus gracilis]
MSPLPPPGFPALQGFVLAGQALVGELLRLMAGDVAAAGIDAQRLHQLRQAYIERQWALLNALLAGEPLPQTGGAADDRRFAATAWVSHPVFDYLRRSYLLLAEFLHALAELVPFPDAKSQQRLCFLVRQYVDAMSPANFALTNPEFMQRALETQGESINEGIRHLLDDIARGRITTCDEAAFSLGENVAATPGSVVFENELIQLIQYAPLTRRVARRPLLMVPPCINKFYILDLQAQNSFVRHAVEQGNTVFLVSWRNVSAAQGHLGWDDYVRLGPLAALRAVRAICRGEDVNALGFCVGGTLLASTLAVLAARGEAPVASLTLLTTLLDFSEAGELSLFIDEAALAAREQAIGQGGLLPASELAGVFSALRANDLVWHYVANNYLLGRSPPAFDLLFWNADSTNLPGPFACWYMRHLYHENALREPGRLRMCGVPVDLSAVCLPTYVLAAREDHIVPWHGAYRSAHLLGGPTRFVLGASGHIAGVVNPARRNRRSYWLNPALPAQPDEWLAAATENCGSWWNDWSGWFRQHTGGERAARTALGSSRYPPREPAPGRYVREPA